MKMKKKDTFGIFTSSATTLDLMYCWCPLHQWHKSDPLSGICRSINICCVWDQTPSGLFCHSPCLDQPMKLSWLGISCCGGWQLPFQQASAACSLVFWRKDECLSSRMPSADELTATGIEEWPGASWQALPFPLQCPLLWSITSLSSIYIQAGKWPLLLPQSYISGADDQREWGSKRVFR